MRRYFTALVLLFIISICAMAQEDTSREINICLGNFDTQGDASLEYMSKAINNAIINRLLNFTNIKTHSIHDISAERLNNPYKLLDTGKVYLLQIHRETGFDGIVFGKITRESGKLTINMNLIDFSSGKIYFTGDFNEEFGSSLLKNIEDKIDPFAKSLMVYYTSSLSITSDPENAEVLINGSKAGITPINNLDVEDGLNNIQVKAKGYAPYQKEVEIKPGQKVFIHAQLYDLIVDHIRNKESSWQLDSHNISYIQMFEIQDIPEIGLEAMNTSGFRYYAKFGRLSAGFDGTYCKPDASQQFDTFLGEEEGYEPISLEITRGSVFGYFNLIDKPGSFELYLGIQGGVCVSNIFQYNAPAGLDDIQTVNPLAGGEIGVNFYLSRSLKLSVMGGGYYAGDIEYAAKEASYWGESQYILEKVPLNPFYLGASLSLTLWAF